MRTQVAMLLVAILGTAGCGARLATIRVSEEASTTVPRGTLLEDLVGGLGFGDFIAMDLTESSELQNQGVDPGDIRDVRLEVFELEATAPEGADLSFLQSMTVSVEAPDLPAVVIAEQDAFAEGEAVVVFDRPEVDLTDYVVSQSMTFTTDVSGTRPSEDTDVTARFTVAVGVTGQAIFGGGGADGDGE